MLEKMVIESGISKMVKRSIGVYPFYATSTMLMKTECTFFYNYATSTMLIKISKRRTFSGLKFSDTIKKIIHQHFFKPRRGLIIVEINIQACKNPRRGFIKREFWWKNILNYKNMGLIKEPEGVDFVINSPALTDKERLEISAFIRASKLENKKAVLLKRAKKKSITT